MTALATPLASLAATPLPPAAGEVARGGGSVSGGSVSKCSSSEGILPPCTSRGCADRAILQPVALLQGSGAPRTLSIEGSCLCLAHALHLDASFHSEGGLLDAIWRFLSAEATKDGAAPPVRAMTELLFRVIP